MEVKTVAYRYIPLHTVTRAQADGGQDRYIPLYIPLHTMRSCALKRMYIHPLAPKMSQKKTVAKTEQSSAKALSIKSPSTTCHGNTACNSMQQ